MLHKSVDVLSLRQQLPAVPMRLARSHRMRPNLKMTLEIRAKVGIRTTPISIITRNTSSEF
eukprot:403120-Amphidinium_carterae.1